MLKTYILLAILIMVFIGCNEVGKNDPNNRPTDSRQNSTPFSSPTATPTPKDVPEEILYICSFHDDISKCEINAFAKSKLILIASRGNFFSKMLDLREIREKYRLTDENVKCLKENFCKEEF